jgi:enoyl-CoA hydratase
VSEQTVVSTDVTDDGILVVRLDDGDKNTLTPDRFDQLTAAFDTADDEVRAIVLTGRDGILTAGLDVRWMAANGRSGVRDLLERFGRCAMRLWTDPRPTICAAGGHAIAAGTMLAMACDHAVAAEGGWWGLVETRIDFELPGFGIALARANVRADRLEDLLLPGERVDAATAVDAGFADEVVPADQVHDRALARARELAELPPRAYAGTKQRLRGAAAAVALDELTGDIEALTRHLDDPEANG